MTLGSGWVSEGTARYLIKIFGRSLWCGVSTSRPGEVFVSLSEDETRKAVACKCAHGTCGHATVPGGLL